MHICTSLNCERKNPEETHTDKGRTCIRDTNGPGWTGIWTDQSCSEATVLATRSLCHLTDIQCPLSYQPLVSIKSLKKEQCFITIQRWSLTCPLLARSSTVRLLSRQSPRPKSHKQHVRSFFTRMLELFRSRWMMGTFRHNQNMGVDLKIKAFK